MPWVLKRAHQGCGPRHGATISVRYLGKSVARSLRFSAVSSSLACGGGDARLATGKPTARKNSSCPRRAQAEHTRHLCGLVLEHVRGVGRNIDGRPGANGLRLAAEGELELAFEEGKQFLEIVAMGAAAHPARLPTSRVKRQAWLPGRRGEDPLSWGRRRDSWLPCSAGGRARAPIRPINQRHDARNVIVGNGRKHAALSWRATMTDGPEFLQPPDAPLYSAARAFSGTQAGSGCASGGASFTFALPPVSQADSCPR
jgi:hypothetical protein